MTEIEKLAMEHFGPFGATETKQLGPKLVQVHVVSVNRPARTVELTIPQTLGEAHNLLVIVGAGWWVVDARACWSFYEAVLKNMTSVTPKT